MCKEINTPDSPELRLILFAFIVARRAVRKKHETPHLPQLIVLLFLDLSSLCRLCAKRNKLQTHQGLEFHSFCIYRRAAGCVQKGYDSNLTRAWSFIIRALVFAPQAECKKNKTPVSQELIDFLGFALFVELPAVCNNNEIRIHQSLGFYSFCLCRRPADRELKKGKLHTHQSLQLLFCAYRRPLLAVCKKNKTPDSTELGVLLLRLSSLSGLCAKRRKLEF